MISFVDGYFHVANLHVKSKVDNLIFYISAIINLGNGYRESGKLEKSANLLEEAVTIRRSCYSPSHSSLAYGMQYEVINVEMRIFNFIAYIFSSLLPFNDV